MKSTMDELERVLGPEGRLSRSLAQFEFRPSQLQMARLIQDAVQSQCSAVIEAGTGTGKTLGYLMPVVMSGKKTVISTGTKNLQEQIFFKDIPLLARATGWRIQAMLMKGRKNYLCLHRYHQFLAQPSLFEPERTEIENKMASWLTKTEFADRAELPWLADDDPLWGVLSSSSEQCLGHRCVHQEECYLNALRREAARSSLIIVNHHLFFADLMVKRGGFGEIIPRCEVVVLDEAHAVEETATVYFGDRLSTSQLKEFLSDTESAMESKGEDLGTEKGAFHQGLIQIRTGMEALVNSPFLPGDRGLLDQKTLRTIREQVVDFLRQGLDGLRGALEVHASEDGLFQGLAMRAEDMGNRLDRILEAGDPNWLTWYEKRKRTIILHASPLEIADNMKTELYGRVKTVVLTSATLSTNGNFDYIRSRLGLDHDVLEERFPSHFDLKNQTLLYIPTDLPRPDHPGFGSRLVERIRDILTITDGRALVLFTGYHNLNLVYDRIHDKTGFTLYRQGDAPRTLLLEKFRDELGSVLLATGSFWQGVDVPGESLSCLIVDKLPFDSPGEPLVAARIQAIKERGDNPFMTYQLPSAIINLKQGLGRLIRNSGDRGVLCILDKRIKTSRYGRFFLESLPDLPRTNDLARLKAFFQNIRYVV